MYLFGSGALIAAPLGNRHLLDTPAECGFSGWIAKPIRAHQAMGTLLAAVNHRPVHGNGASRNANETPRKARHRGRILVAEDNAVNQRVAVGLLKRAGYDADVAANGLEALRMFAENRYDAILMDCQMPEMDGYVATRKIRQAEEGTSTDASARIPIIAVTAHAGPAEKDKCLAVGMDDHLSKPLRSDDLRHMLEMHLGQHWPEPASTPQLEPSSAGPGN